MQPELQPLLQAIEMNKRYPVVGLRHHAWSDRIQQLDEIGVGQTVMLSVDATNPVEPNAVIVFMGKTLLGYVRTGADREEALRCIETSGSPVLMGHIVEVDVNLSMVWVEADEEREESAPSQCLQSELNAWHYTGPVLPMDNDTRLFHMQAEVLLVQLRQQHPWNASMAEALQTVTGECWRDVSAEGECRLRQIASLLEAYPPEPCCTEAAQQVRHAIDGLGSNHARLCLTQIILQVAHREDTLFFLLSHSKELEAVATPLPHELLCMFLQDPLLFMGTLRYKRLGRTDLCGLFTLLAMHIVLLERQTGSPLTLASTPEGYKLQWSGDSHAKEHPMVDDALRQFLPRHYTESQLSKLEQLHVCRESVTVPEEGEYKDNCVCVVPIGQKPSEEGKPSRKGRPSISLFDTPAQERHLTQLLRPWLSSHYLPATQQIAVGSLKVPAHVGLAALYYVLTDRHLVGARENVSGYHSYISGFFDEQPCSRQHLSQSYRKVKCCGVESLRQLTMEQVQHAIAKYSGSSRALYQGISPDEYANLWQGLYEALEQSL